MTRDRSARRLWLTLLVAAALELPAGEALGVSQYLNAFNDEYGTAGTRLDTCGLCHVNFGNNSAGRNDYGLDFEAVPGFDADPRGALLAIAARDPDGDGTPSADEILALFMPGWRCATVAQAGKAPPDLMDYVDPAKPGCQAAPEANCADRLDDDGDGLIDCADPDCDGSLNGACDTGRQGICAAGMLVCSEGAEQCIADELPQPEGPTQDPSCSDALDNDCDGLLDLADPGCELLREADCFDGLDNDGDALADCADPDCDGAMAGTCQTGERGICAAGTLLCGGGQPMCVADSGPETEGPAGDASCSDGLDNDCDGVFDAMDPQCEAPPGDVFALRLRAPNALKLRLGNTVTRQVVLTADGDARVQEATAELVASPAQGITVGVDPSSITRSVRPGGGATRFSFYVDITCAEAGSWLVQWTATISAAENQNALDDALQATTTVTCR